MLTGSASIILPSLEAGASGAILGFGACAPEACYEVYFAWKDRDPQLAAEKQQRIIKASQRITGEFGISGSNMPATSTATTADTLGSLCFHSPRTREPRSSSCWPKSETNLKFVNYPIQLRSSQITQE